MGKEKIIGMENIEELSRILREGENKIVTTNGAFDILHPGHLHSFYHAKRYGDILIVGLNSDESIKQYKAVTRPINNELSRATMLSALECVDYVCIFPETDPIIFLSLVKPKVHVKSKEGYKGLEREIMAQLKGRVVLIEDVGGHSTSEVIYKAAKSYFWEPPKESYE